MKLDEWVLFAEIKIPNKTKQKRSHCGKLYKTNFPSMTRRKIQKEKVAKEITVIIMEEAMVKILDIRGRNRKGIRKIKVQHFNCKKLQHYAFECWHDQSNLVQENVNYAKKKVDGDGVLLIA